MQILAIYMYLATLVIPYYYLVLGTNKPVLIAKIYTASSILNIILNFLLIPRNGLLAGVGIMGPTGAATATLLSSFVLFGGTYYYSRKIAGKPLLEGRILKHIAAGILAGALAWWLGSMVDPIRWYHLIVLSLAILGTYLGALRTMGEFGRSELIFFLETMNPVKLLKHVRNEFTGRKGGNSD
jgi:O-antigen/teichoic acid export membrane protein